MPRLYVPIGIPGSGKSTWLKIFLPGGVRVSTDEIRDDETLFPGGYVYSKESNTRVFDEFHRVIERRLSYGFAVAADATNLQAKHRRPLLDIAERTDSDVYYIVFTNVAQAVLRNAARPSRVVAAGGDRQYTRPGAERVPDEAMLGFVAQYEVALKEILIEPYESITYIERTL